MRIQTATKATTVFDRHHPIIITLSEMYVATPFRKFCRINDFVRRIGIPSENSEIRNSADARVNGPYLDLLLECHLNTTRHYHSYSTEI
jgi:hypothetical protein